MDYPSTALTVGLTVLGCGLVGLLAYGWALRQKRKLQREEEEGMRDKEEDDRVFSIRQVAENVTFSIMILRSKKYGLLVTSVNGWYPGCGS